MPSLSRKLAPRPKGATDFTAACFAGLQASRTFQEPAQVLFRVVGKISYRVSCVSQQSGEIGLIPATLSHLGRESTIESKPINSLRRSQHRGQQPVIPVQNSEGPASIQANKKYSPCIFR